MSQTTKCPGCGVVSQVDESLIGRFIRCDQCRCMYYVVVPPLGQEHREWVSFAASSPATKSSSPSASTSAPRTESESLVRQMSRLHLLQVWNLLIGLIVLVLLIVQSLK